MVITTPLEEVKKYHESNALGQSTLKDLLKGFDKYVIARLHDEKEDEEKVYLSIGSAVDVILTGEEGDFEKEFHISELKKKPSENEMKIINQVFKTAKDLKILRDNSKLESFPDQIDQSTQYYNWYMNLKVDTRVNKIVKAGAEYFEELKIAQDKTILSVDQYNLILDICENLRNSWRTARYFDREGQADAKNIDFYYQLPIYFEHEGIELKALLDLVIVWKDEKGEITKIQPIDLKTMYGHTTEFIENFKKYRYDIQAAWYTLALSKYFDFPKEKIENFMFIVESTSFIGKPLVYQVDKSIRRIGEFGNPEITDDSGFRIRPAIFGYIHLLEEYKSYIAQEWKEDKRTYEKSVIPLSWNGIIDKIETNEN